jgi:hypothetical protein
MADHFFIHEFLDGLKNYTGTKLLYSYNLNNTAFAVIFISSPSPFTLPPMRDRLSKRGILIL